MSAGEDTLETALAQLLAKRGEPQVPGDLARRIVVRTAHLPQFSNDEVVVTTGLPDPVPSFEIARTWLRATLPYGAALAASLILALIAQPSSQGLQSAAPSQGSVSPNLAATNHDTVSQPEVATPAAHASSTTGAEIALAKNDASGHPATRAPSIERAATIRVDAPTSGEPAETGSALSSWHGATVEKFALKEQGDPSPAVYGPVLEPEPVRLGSGMSGRAAATSGLAAGPSRTANSGVPKSMP